MAKSDLLRTAVYLPPELHEALRHLAFEQKTTMSEIVRQAVVAWLNQNKKGGK